jgi:CheY-like chemotaxis protein
MTSLAYDLLDLPDENESSWLSCREPGGRHLSVVADLEDQGMDAPGIPASEEPRRARVLIAEDDHEMRQMLAEEFQEAGYRVFEVADGKQLFRCVKSRNTRPICPEPDLLISDIRMPGLTGMEVLRYLRKSDWTMPVIMITAFGDKQTHEEARKLGAAAVLDKPFEVEDLVHAAKSIVPTEI